jgi:hypothetical protein
MILAAPPQSLVALFDPWATFYGDSSLAQTVVTFAHVGGLVVGGGLAIATDRATLRVMSDVDRRRHLLDLSRLHRTVITSLAIIAISGLMLLTADLETFWASWIFWVKMLLVIALLVNGARMRRVESAASGDAVVSPGHWSALRGSAMTSLALWLTITLAGVALINYA